MIRSLARTLLTLVLVGSLSLTGVSAWRISQDPLLQPLVERSAAEIVAASDAEMARAATPERITERLEALLAAKPRNWLAITAVQDVAAERGTAITPDLAARIAAAKAEDHSLLASARACAACAINPASCELSAVLLCQAPMVLTPLGDLAGVTIETGHYISGAEIDRVNLALSLVGLAAAGLVVASGGTSATVKVGASTAKLARQMKLLSPNILRLMTEAAETGIDWARVSAARSSDALMAALNPRVVTPLVRVLNETGRIAARLDLTETLHILRYIDGPDDARRLANAAEALGPKTIGRLEILGKSRFLRATLKYSDTAWAVLTGLVGLFYSLAALIGSALQHGVLHMLRSTARRRRSPPA
jgi:hypothetical protein